VSYWVDLALGQEEFPRDTCISHVKWMKWFGSRLMGIGLMTYKGS
jgi:hypothetical protein